MKNTFKFEVSFNLHTQKGEEIDKKSVKDFQGALKAFIEEYNDYHGSFYCFGPFHDRTADAEQVKVKPVK
ncbi:MAG: hypothetical protein VKK63_11875 [Synechococcus sp.]|nr:hypothetical protein [Synechococcus sp.]